MIVMKDEVKEYLIQKLTELKIETEFEDRKRGKKRWISKASAYQDLIKLIKEYL